MAFSGLPLSAAFAIQAVVAASLACNRLAPTFQSIPQYVDTAGPFGIVCEVKAGDALPSPPAVPEKLSGKAFVVTSSFPDGFMEQSTVQLHKQVQATVKKPLVSPHGGVSETVLLQRKSSLNKAEEENRSLSSKAVSSGWPFSPGVNCGNGLSVGRVGDEMDEKVWGMKSGGPDWFGLCTSCGRNLELEGKLKRGWFCRYGGAPWAHLGVWLKRKADRNGVSTVKLNFDHERQEILGFGGAFTDAVAHDNEQLHSELKQAWVKAYFGKEGLGYTLARVPMGGADFSLKGYALDNTEGDFNLTDMCLRDDREGSKCGEDYKLPIIREALTLEPDLKLFSSPWSAPAWLKTSKEIVGGHIRGLGSGADGPEDQKYAEAWARSFVKFVDLLADEGIPLWGTTLQNEPGADQFVSWNSEALSGFYELKLVNLLGPLLKEKYPHMKIMVHDDQVYALEERLLESGKGILSSEYVDGVAYHWYGTMAGTYENTDAEHLVKALPIGPPAVGGGTQVKDIYEHHIQGTGKFLFMSEACNGYLVPALHALRDTHSMSNNRGVRPGDWYRGYRYSRDILYQLANGASGWVDWNFLLNSEGGPNWANNYVDAPILASPDGDALWVAPMYFHMAHFSKYVVPGSKLLAVDTSDSDLHEVVAFRRPDKRIVVVALCDTIDGSGDPPAGQSLRIVVDGYEVLVPMTSGSIVTLVFDSPEHAGQSLSGLAMKSAHGHEDDADETVQMQTPERLRDL